MPSSPKFYLPKKVNKLATLFKNLLCLMEQSEESLKPCCLTCTTILCSRNFQNMKLRLDFIQIWSFYRHSDFMWNRIFGNSNSPKMLILTILKVLNFDFCKFEQLPSSKFAKNAMFKVSKIAKNDIFGPFEFTKIGFHSNSEWR